MKEKQINYQLTQPLQYMKSEKIYQLLSKLLDTDWWMAMCVTLFVVISVTFCPANCVNHSIITRVLQLDTDGSEEYKKQLILGTVYNVCTRTRKLISKGKLEASAGVKGEHLNLELVVQCIRTSENQHTHQQALLLLSIAAHIAPVSIYTLHTIMWCY